MATEQPPGSRLQRAYETFHRHKKALVYWDVALIVVALVIGTRFEAVSRALLPPALLALVVIVIESLTRLEATVSHRFGRLEANMDRFLQPEEFATGPDGEAAILKLVAESKARPTTVDIVSATGGSNLPFLRGLERLAQTKPVRLNLYLVEADVPSPVPLPDHWETEIETTLRSIRGEFGDSALELSVYQYSHLPFLRAILVDHEQLLLGFFRWVRAPKAKTARFAGAETPHRLYRKSDPETLHFVGLVEDWLAHAPKRQIVPAASG